MPKAPPRPCNKYGCPKMVEKDGFCLDHWRPRWKQHKSGPKIHDTAVWKKVRAVKLRRDPVCECDDPHCHLLADTVHHIIAVEDGGPPFDYDNLRSLFRDCHERIEGRKK
ncbi:MAG: HNH endonuclease [Deltaproteobacteria bacterium]|nr:HNH endonuclease [Deltaproteobacteria bacterium]